MPYFTLTPADLQVFAPDLSDAKAQVMIDDAVALAVVHAPCLQDASFDKRDAAKAILRGAILRWNDAGTGAVQSESYASGPYSMSQTVDTSQVRRSMFLKSEIKELRRLCGSARREAFSVDLAPAPVVWLPIIGIDET